MLQMPKPKADESKEEVAAQVAAEENASQASIAPAEVKTGRGKDPVEAFLNDADDNEDGVLSKAEFEKLLEIPEVEHLIALSENESGKTYDIGNLFTLADEDGDGQVSLEELVAGAEKLGVEEDDEDVEEELVDIGKHLQKAKSGKGGGSSVSRGRSGGSSARYSSPRRRSGSGSGCFGRESSFAFAAASTTGPWRVTKMLDLKAGDHVLALDETTGAPFADRVFMNLHLLDESQWPLLEINHTLGSLTVTPDHVLFVDGSFMAARHVRPGSSMVVTTLRHAEREQSGVSNVAVLSVVPTYGKIVNPLTHTGVILVATGDGEGAIGLLAATVLESPGNSMLAMARMPGMCKLASYLFPEAFQASTFPEQAILLVANLSKALPPWLGFCAFALVDVLAGSWFILWSSGLVVLAAAAYFSSRARRSVV